MKTIIITVLICTSTALAVTEDVITVCEVQKTAAVYMASSEFDEKGKRQINSTSFAVDAKPTGEKYTLSKIRKADRNIYDDVASQLEFFNISFSSTKFTWMTWNAIDTLKKDNGEGNILHRGQPLIIRTYYPGVNDQVYYFDLDKDSNGVMTMVSTRWSSFMDATNNQTLVYAICKNPYP